MPNQPPRQPRLAPQPPPMEGREEVFRALVHDILDYAIFLLAPDGTILTWNRGAQRIKGYAEAEIVGRNVSTFYVEKDRASGRPSVLLNMARTDGRVEIEDWRVRKDGSRFWADVVITALRDDSGELWGFAKVTRDLTERRANEQRERELLAEQKAREAAEEALRARDRFLSIASHELKTPVTTLQLSTELLLRASSEGRLDGRALVAGLSRIASATHRLGVLLSELLDVARLSASSPMPLTRHPTDVGALVREVADRRAGGPDEARLHVDLAPARPVLADADRLDQVISNVVENALKYSTGAVGIRVAEAEDGVAIEVEDEGIGLVTRDLTGVFEPFARGDNVGHVEGMGLGLYIARGIVERHHGRIDAHSQGPGAGSTFRIWIPAAPPREDQ